jgi:GAF domain-containing protein/CheY-like chemotaxis protein/anti-sigma regulatory factor (Ser/Thr protein kinase)
MAGEKILIIEDEQDIAMMVDTLMKECGYRTVIARDGLSGLDLALQERPDLILLDLRLPQMSGVQLLYRLHEQQVNTSVVVVTAWGSEELAVQALRMGVKDYIKKPFSLNELLEVVERALEEGRLRRERDSLTKQLLVSNEQLKQRVRQITSLYEVGQALASTLDLDELLNVILQEACRVLEVDVASIMLLDEQTGELVFRSGTGGMAERLVNLRLAPGQGVAGWVAQHGEPLLVRHAPSDPRFDPAFDQITGFTTESILCVPLILKGRMIGVVEVLNKPQAGFTEDDLAMLRSLATSAAVAIENTQLFTREKRRASEMETLVEIAHAVTRAVTEDSRALLERIARGACEVLHADCALVYPFVVEPDTDDVSKVVTFGTLHPLELSHQMPTGDSVRLIRKRRLSVCEDIARDQPALLQDPFFEQESIQAFVSVLLEADEEELGVLYVSFRAPRRFKERELTAVRLIAHQAALAIAKSRLFETLNRDVLQTNVDLRRKVQELEELQTINNMISSTLEIDKVLDGILRGVMSITGAPYANILMTDEGNGAIISHMRREGRTFTQRIDPKQTVIIPSIAEKERSTIVQDMTEPPVGETSWSRIYRQLIPGARSFLYTPIMSGGEQERIGLLGIGSPQVGEFGPDDRRLLEALANQAAIAIQNARYLQAVRVYQEQQVEAERIAAIADVAANMVHRINNTVGAIRPLIQQIEMKLERDQLDEDYLYEKLQRIRENANHTLEVARQIQRPFQLVPLQPIDVNESIAAAWADLKTPVGVKVSIEYGQDLPPVKATRQLDEVFRNLMKNALDAMAQEGGLLLVRSRRLDDRLVAVMVKDTGPGIPPEIRDKIFRMGTTTKPGGMGYGLWWSRMFLRRLGGDMVLESQEGRGCMFTVTLPISEA